MKLEYIFISLIVAIILYYILKFYYSQLKALRNDEKDLVSGVHHTGFWKGYESLKTIIFIITFAFLFLLAVGFFIFSVLDQFL